MEGVLFHEFNQSRAFSPASADRAHLACETQNISVSVQLLHTYLYPHERKCSSTTFQGYPSILAEVWVRLAVCVDLGVLL